MNVKHIFFFVCRPFKSFLTGSMIDIKINQMRICLILLHFFKNWIAQKNEQVIKRFKFQKNVEANENLKNEVRLSLWQSFWKTFRDAQTCHSEAYWSQRAAARIIDFIRFWYHKGTSCDLRHVRGLIWDEDRWGGRGHQQSMK